MSAKAMNLVPVTDNRTFSKGSVIAGRIGIHKKTLSRWADAGLIGRHKINARVVLFDEAEILRFVDSARVRTEGRATQ